MGDELDLQSWERLSAYLDGALDDIATAMVERDLRRTPELRQALDQLKRQKLALRRWASEVDARPVPPGVRMLLDRARREADGRDENPSKE